MVHILIVQQVIAKYAQFQVALNALVMDNVTKNVWIIAKLVIQIPKFAMNALLHTLCHKESAKF